MLDSFFVDPESLGRRARTAEVVLERSPGVRFSACGNWETLERSTDDAIPLQGQQCAILAKSVRARPTP